MKKTGSIWVIPLAAALLSACVFSPNQAPLPPSVNTPKAEVVFQVTVPVSAYGNSEYILEVVDEVTGLPFNPVRYPLTPIDSSHYFGRLPFNVGEILKYRYVRIEGIPKVEFTAKNEPVRYRLHQVTGPAILEDLIAGWEGLPYSGPTGNLTGTVTNMENVPIPNAMVVAGGDRTFTDSEGQFDLVGLPVGLQNVAVLSLDGAQSFFEQGARISENAVTPARISLASQGNVQVTFEVNPAAGMDTGIPLRLIGELYQLGNTFTDLEGGMSTIASRAPTLFFNPDKKQYEGEFSLPAGVYFRYKYSLGDGFWNAETDENGQFVLRELTIPGEGTRIRDGLIGFDSPGYAPLEFQIAVPGNTPPGDTVSIQFDPFSPMGPIPTSPQGNNQWKFILSSPLNIIPQASFYVCRNEQCGVTDADLSGMQTVFSPSSNPQTIPVNVQSWRWMDNHGVQPTLPDQVPAKGNDFLRGVELDRNYQPGWQPFFDAAYQSIQEINANWVFLTPTWSIRPGYPSSIGIYPGDNPFWQDTSRQIQEAKSRHLYTALYPSLNNFSDPQNGQVPLPQAQWEEWFQEYRSFLLFYADLAAVNQADALILGGPGAEMSLPDKIAVSDRNTAEAADISTKQWESVITELRSHFKGKILWSSRTPLSQHPLPAFTQQLDGVYLLWNGIPNYDSASSLETLKTQIAGQFPDAEIQNLTSYGKPIIIGLWIESTAGKTENCSQAGSLCLDEQQTDNGNPAGQLDLQQQVNLYSAALEYFSNQSWVNGIISRGFYPPAALLDPSASVHGKPAGETLSSWFLNFANGQNP